ncbi:hypothetical protein M9H77_11676 [Catharanthus roseus]|uniref:Uncharacterized protein n=1 Tax=Catharanthus roseus TaxID=4058 RepID=A0ACC0BFB7_CATRO|nr:hypothetical protein M9H77_11676 [Catharanthus roseus]
MNAVYHYPATSPFYLYMPPPCSLRALFSLNMRTRVRKIRSVFFSSSPCTNLKRCRFPVALDAGSVVVETSQSSDFEIRSDSVTRRLILLRHAQSSWENRFLRDHDRPLSNTGEADAVKVSHKLRLLGWIPELILSSDARRTRETLKIMQDEVQGFADAEVHFLASFYSVAAMDGQTAEHLQQSICEFSRDEILTVMCMGHNRGWEEAASVLSGVSVELKTCNAALLQATGKSWEEAFSVAGFGGWKLLHIVKPDAGH